MRGRVALLFGTTVVLGVLVGGAISLAAFYVARYGPSGGNWSFRGNGAIAVYAAFPAVLSGGWTGLALHWRGVPWFWRGLAAAIIGLAIALLAAAILPLAGVAADRLGSPIAYISLLAWMVAAPVVATTAGTAADRAAGSGALHFAAAGLWLAAGLAGMVVVGILVPAGS